MKCTYSCQFARARDREAWVPRRAGGLGGRVGGRRAGHLLESTRGGSAEQPAEAGRRLQHARRLEPARKLGPEARDRDRRPVPVDRDLGARHPDLRAAAERRQADAPPLPGPRREHERGRPRQGSLHDAHRPPADPRRRLPVPGGRLRQGHGARRQRLARPHRHHARRRRRPRQRLPPTSGPSTRASPWATASLPRTRPGPARSPSRWTPPATTSANGSTTGS